MVLLWGWSLTLAKSIRHLARRIPTNTSCACSSYKSPGRRSQISGIIQVHTCTFTCLYIYILYIYISFNDFYFLYTFIHNTFQLFLNYMFSIWYVVGIWKYTCLHPKQYVFYQKFPSPNWGHLSRSRTHCKAMGFLVAAKFVFNMKMLSCCDTGNCDLWWLCEQWQKTVV